MGSRFPLLVLAAAVPAVATPAEVTEESLLAALREDHPALVTASAVEEESRAESLRARLLPNPSVDYGTERPSGATKQDEWGVSWALPFDGRYGAREDVASARADGMRLGARARATASEATGLEARRLELELPRPAATSRPRRWSATRRERTLASRLLFSPEVRAGDQTQRDPAGTERSGPVLSASLSLPLFERGQADRAGRRAAPIRRGRARDRDLRHPRPPHRPNSNMRSR